MKVSKVTKSWLLDKFSSTKFAKDIESIRASSDDFIYFTVQSHQEYKTNNQNACFHSLLTIFWKSGMSSFRSYDELRLHYKRIAGLVKSDKNPISEELKVLLRAFYSHMDNSELRDELVSLINDGRLVIDSWANVKKEKATEAINTLIDDMYEAGVNTKEFQDVMQGLDK